jgi:hypothetical protein
MESQFMALNKLAFIEGQYIWRGEGASEQLSVKVLHIELKKTNVFNECLFKRQWEADRWSTHKKIVLSL